MTTHTQGKAQAQKRPPEKTLSSHFRLMLGTERDYSNQNKNKQTKNNYIRKAENPGEGGESDFQNYHVIRFKCRAGKYGPFKGKK